MSFIIYLLLLQNEATISFLRAARSGDLGKVLEFLDSGQITDINACNAVSIMVSRMVNVNLNLRY